MNRKSIVKRVVSFDVIRAIAIVGIVFAHQLLSRDGLFPLAFGRWLGSTFSAVFLALSALLLGRAWHEKGRPAYGGRFLLHRFSRLVIPYWLFLTVFLMVAYATGHFFPVKDIALNYALLGWLAKISGMGHFWFITMISICYVAIVIISRLFQADWWRRFLPVMLTMGCAGLYALLAHYRLPAYMAFILLYYCLLFVYADSILEMFRRHGKRIVRIGTPILLLLMPGLFVSGTLTGGNDNLIVMGCSLCGIAIFSVLQVILSTVKKCPRFLSDLSGVSYEWYLVHHPMIIGPVALSQFIPSRPVTVVCYWVVSICCAFLLKYLTSFSSRLFHA